MPSRVSSLVRMRVSAEESRPRDTLLAPIARVGLRDALRASLVLCCGVSVYPAIPVLATLRSRDRETEPDRALVAPLGSR